MKSNELFIAEAKKGYLELQQETNLLYKRHFVGMPSDLERCLSTKASDSEIRDAEEVEKEIIGRTGLQFDIVAIGEKCIVRKGAYVRIVPWGDAIASIADDKMHGSADDKFAAYMNAFSSAAVFVDIPKGKEARVNMLFLPGAAPALYQLFVDVGKESSLDMLEVHADIGDTTKASLSGTMREVKIEEGGRAELNSVHAENGNATVLAFCKAIAAEGGTLGFNALYSGGAQTRVRNTLEASGRRSSVAATEMVFGGGEQKFDISSNIINGGSETSASLSSKAALDGRSVCMLKGLAKLIKGAHGSRSYVHERGMLLGGGAHIDGMPDMSVDDSDVKATHSSATAPLDPETEFYLKSRGLGGEEVRRLVVSGFFASCLSRMGNAAMRELTMSVVNDRLGGGAGSVAGRSIDSRGIWSVSNDAPEKDMFMGHYKYR